MSYGESTTIVATGVKITTPARKGPGWIGIKVGHGEVQTSAEGEGRVKRRGMVAGRGGEA